MTSQHMDAASSSSRWLEVAKLFIILAAFMAARNSFGIFFKFLEEDFGLSRGATSAYFSLYAALSAFFSISCGWLMDRYGPKKLFIAMGLVLTASLILTSRADSSWQLFLTYSLLMSAGTGGAFSLVLATVSRWFNQGRGLALGIVLSGEGAGTLAVAPLAAFLIARFDWRPAYMIIGIIVGLLILLFSLLLKKDPYRSDVPLANRAAPADAINIPVVHTGLRLTAAMRTRSFWMMGVVYLLFSLSFHLVLTHIVPHTTDLGITNETASLVVSLMGGFTIPGRLITGWLSDRFDKRLLAAGCAGLQVVSMLWLAWADQTWMFFLFAVVFGYTFGGFSNLMASLIGDIFGTRNLGAITGALVIGFTIGAAIGPVFGGLIFDSTGAYFVSFIAGAAAAVLTGLFLLAIRRETDGKESPV